MRESFGAVDNPQDERRINKVEMPRLGGLAVILGFICLGNDFIKLWVGDTFNESFLCTVLIILPSFFSSPQQIAGEALPAKNKVKKQSIIYMNTAFINIVLACLFIYWWGSLGACIAISVTYFIRWAFTNVLYIKELNISVKRFYSESLFKLLPAFLITLIVGIALNYIITEVSILSFIVKVFVFFLVYIIGIVLLMNKYEREIFIQPCLNFFNN